MIDINYKKRIKKRLKKGNGVLIFGSFFMILILMIVIMFAQIFTMRQSALDLQNAADSISDGTATYLQSEGGNYEDAQKQAVKLKNMINSNTKANIKQLTVNKSSLENNNIVSVKLEKKFKYNTSETKTKLLHIKRIAATEITSGYASGYVQWAIDFASDNSHGYSQANRTLPDVDCSSFVYYSLINAGGFTTAQLGAYPFTTADMGGILQRNGFRQFPFTSVADLKEGDILWRIRHTEIYVGNGQNAGAHSNYDGQQGDSSGKEVNVKETGTHWQYVYRLGGK